MTDTDTAIAEEPSVAAGVELEGRPRRRQRIEDGFLLAVFALFSWFYFWTGTSGVLPLQFNTSQSDPYNEFVDGVLKGHLYLALKVPEYLLKLKDPYDPRQNLVPGPPYHDLSLYHGHFYISWGPTPAFTLFLPWRVLGVGNLDQNLACVIYCALGLGFTLLLVRYLARALVPSYRSWQLVAGGIAIATCSVVPFLLRRAVQYEVAISCSFCCIAAGLWLLAPLACGRATRWWRTGLGSLCLGLAIGGHIDTVVVGLIVLAALGAALFVRRHELGRAVLLRRAAALLGPFGFVLFLLLLYDYVRFGSPFQYGEGYQLAGVNVQTLPTFQLSYLVPGLYYYLFAPVRFSLVFPYFSIPPPPYFPGKVPVSYTPEIVGGMFWTAPITLALLGGVSRVGQAFRTNLGRIVLVLAASGFALAFVLAIAISPTERYEVDFVSLLIVASLLVWLAATSGRGALQRIGRVLGAAAIVLGSVIGLALSITGYYNWLLSAEPGTYTSIENATTWFPQAVTWLVGHPVVTAVTTPDSASYEVGYTDLGIGSDLQFPVSIQQGTMVVVAPSSGVDRLSASVVVSPLLPAGSRVEFGIGKRHVEVPLVGGPLSVGLPLHGGLNSILISIHTPSRTRISPTALLAWLGDAQFR